MKFYNNSIGYDQRFSFDPRYGHTRLAEFDTVRGQITDIKKDRVFVCSNHTLKTKVYRVEYTNDGHLIIVLCTRKHFLLDYLIVPEFLQRRTLLKLVRQEFEQVPVDLILIDVNIFIKVTCLEQLLIEKLF